ncbi:hypothetical protein RJ639_019821 [Escallonia herrerae]|uniref:Acid phosphatase n=1 Tax=Escallonia herrerae TaxID=1293975 RepID=A0AA88VAC9_9ASTE|nr:hypothetical protein RJ639_019821 [Escallonia herrerae]
MKAASFFFLAILLPASNSDDSLPNHIHLLMPHSGHRLPEINCLSWRLAVETDNVRDWDVVPDACEDYVGRYMLGNQYRDDCNAVGDAALGYAASLKLAGDGKDMWVFDIDETALSNLPYYARSDVAFGAKRYNRTKFSEWIQAGKAPAVPAVLSLYNQLISLGFRIAFITGSSELYRESRVFNLKNAGYHSWEKLIFKSIAERGTKSVVFKSKKRKELEGGGYRILGNMGDQWSDLIGTNVGNRTFKLPDPMYYVS